MTKRFGFLVFLICAVGVAFLWFERNNGQGVEDVKFSVDDIVVDKNTYPSVIIGGGPGGLTSAIYLAQAQCMPLVFEGKVPGGALIQSNAVHNWPGEKEISGTDLMDKMRAHALHSGAVIAQEEVVSVDFSQWPFIITSKHIMSGKEREVKALSCVIATGSTPNFLGVPGERGSDGYFGKGVSTCAVCDGALYRDKTVAIVGGGDSAVTEANYLSSLVKEVHILVRRDAFRAADGLKNKVLALSNVKVHFNTEVQKIVGDGKKVTHAVVVHNVTNETSELPLDGLFLAIGFHPNVEIFDEQIEIGDGGYIALKRDQETSQQGVFAVGDVCDHLYKQAITSAGAGCRAALQSMDFLIRTGFDASSFKSQVGVLEKKNDSSEEPKSSESQVEVDEEESVDVVADEVAAVGEVIEVTSEDHLSSSLTARRKPAVIDFYATWCMPCKMMHEIFETNAKTFAGRVDFYRVNVDDVRMLAQKYNVQGIPTFIFLDVEGHESDRVVGAQSPEVMNERIEALL